uniref:Uncharacterized protein n=1 Tax=Lactuca sativa TaxID=4236 RepID=A0A9R1WH39_LACSA|nr:hypothetical protein LSAT_V11C100030840 [Lactuca sativa]
MISVSQDMGIEAPIPISTKLGDFNNIFGRIMRAAEHPHLSIPETEAGKTRKHYHRLLNLSLMWGMQLLLWGLLHCCWIMSYIRLQITGNADPDGNINGLVARKKLAQAHWLVGYWITHNSKM